MTVIWKVTGRYPMGVERTSSDGRYQIWSAKPGTGHMLRYPSDPMRHVVFVVEADGVKFAYLGRYHLLGQAKAAADLEDKGLFYHAPARTGPGSLSYLLDQIKGEK